jgi:hypothetical protein
MTITNDRLSIVGTVSTRRLTFSGTPTTSGEFTLSFTAINKPLAQVCDQTLVNISNTYNVLPGTATTQCTLPDIQPISSTVFEAGIRYSGTIVIDNSTSVSVSGRPTWLTVSSTTTRPISGTNEFRTTVTLSGTPTSAGQTFNLQIIAKNKPSGIQCGESSSTAISTLSVTAAPPPGNCTTPTVEPLTPNIIKRGTPFNGTITINNATSSTLGALPTGLRWTRRNITGGFQYVITGTLTQNADYTITVSAANTGNGRCIASFANNVDVGSGKAERPICPTPVVIENLMPGVDPSRRIYATRAGQPYSGTIQLRNTTSATLTGLPSGLTYAGSLDKDIYTITVSGTIANNVAGQSFSLYIDAENASNICQTSIAKGLRAGSGRIELGACPIPSLVSGMSVTNLNFDTNISDKIVFANATGLSMSGLPPGLRFNVLKVGTNIEVTIDGMVAFATGVSSTYNVVANVFNEIISGPTACNKVILEKQSINTLTFNLPAPVLPTSIDGNFYVDMPHLQHLVFSGINIVDVTGLPAGIKYTVNARESSDNFLRPGALPFGVTPAPISTANNTILTLWGYPNVPYQKANIKIEYTEKGSSIKKQFVTDEVSVKEKCSYPKILLKEDRLYTISDTVTNNPITKSSRITNYPQITERTITVNYDRYFDNDLIFNQPFDDVIEIDNVTAMSPTTEDTRINRFKQFEGYPAGAEFWNNIPGLGPYNSQLPDLQWNRTGAVGFVLHPGLKLTIEDISNNKMSYRLSGTPQAVEPTLPPVNGRLIDTNWDYLGKLTWDAQLCKPVNDCYPAAATTGNASSLGGSRIKGAYRENVNIVGGFANTGRIMTRVMRPNQLEPVVPPSILLYPDSGDPVNSFSTSMTIGQPFSAIFWIRNADMYNGMDDNQWIRLPKIQRNTNYGNFSNPVGSRTFELTFVNSGGWREQNAWRSSLFPGLKISSTVQQRAGGLDLFKYFISGTPQRPTNSKDFTNVNFESKTYSYYIGVHSTRNGENVNSIQRPYTFELKFNITNL